MSQSYVYCYLLLIATAITADGHQNSISQSFYDIVISTADSNNNCNQIYILLSTADGTNSMHIVNLLLIITNQCYVLVAICG